MGSVSFLDTSNFYNSNNSQGDKNTNMAFFQGECIYATFGFDDIFVAHTKRSTEFMNQPSFGTAVPAYGMTGEVGIQGKRDKKRDKEMFEKMVGDKDDEIHLLASNLISLDSH